MRSKLSLERCHRQFRSLVGELEKQLKVVALQTEQNILSSFDHFVGFSKTPFDH